MRHAIGRSSYIEHNRDSLSQCGHVKSRLQLAPQEVQPPVKPCLRRRFDARPGTHPIIARRILPRMIVLPGCRSIACGSVPIADRNART